MRINKRNGVSADIPGAAFGESGVPRANAQPTSTMDRYCEEPLVESLGNIEQLPKNAEP
jgi:hypothetical protein